MWGNSWMSQKILLSVKSDVLREKIEEPLMHLLLLLLSRRLKKQRPEDFDGKEEKLKFVVGQKMLLLCFSFYQCFGSELEE